MIEITPAILVKTHEELKQRIAEVEPFVNRFHLDIMDGKFVPNKTIQPEEIAGLNTKLMKEVHLMVDDVDRYVDEFLRLNFDMIAVHFEQCGNIHKIIRNVKRGGKKMALAINPQTPLSVVKDYLDDLDMVLIMSVNPGSSGQVFNLSVLPKIRELRGIKENLDIEVDGGIKVGTANLTAEAGANILASCSGIYGFGDKEMAIKLLKKDADYCCNKIRY